MTEARDDEELAVSERLPDSFEPMVASGREAPLGPRERGALWLLGRAARGGAFGGLLAGVLGGVPYYLAVRADPEIDLPWAVLGPSFVMFVVATGAIYASGAALGAFVSRRVVAKRTTSGPARGAALVTGGMLGGAIVGPLPGAFGVAYFGSQPYPFMGTAMLAVAPFLGAYLTSAEVARALHAVLGVRVGFLRALGASVAATALFGGLGFVVYLGVDDQAMLQAFRSGSTSVSGEPFSVVGLALVGTVAGVLLGLGLGGHIGCAAAIAGGGGAGSDVSSRGTSSSRTG
jgi:hypothetical protein